jgi:ABC-type branched-subunit amino acid transport system ATPase component
MTERILGVIRGLPRQSKAVILIEHDLDAVMQVCDCVVFMDAGAKINESISQQVRDNSRVIEVYIYIGWEPGMLQIQQMETGYGRRQVPFGLLLGVRQDEAAAGIGPNGSGRANRPSSRQFVTSSSRGKARSTSRAICSTAPRQPRSVLLTKPGDHLLRPQALTIAPMPFIEGTPPFQEFPIATEDDTRSQMRRQQV